MNGCESIEITQAAQDDLLAAYWFYELAVLDTRRSPQWLRERQSL
jgi:autonomous glycyl radical cofactor GrcA